MLGWLLIALGAVLFAWTVYTMFVKRTTSWMWGALWLVAGGVLVYYGYQTEYPPVPSLFTGGRSARF